MTETKPSQFADQAREAVRGLNHATLQGGQYGWEFPSDAYDVVGNLAHMAMTLPQALRQIQDHLKRLDATGRVYSTSGATAQDVADALATLTTARESAEILHYALDQAHSALSPLSFRTTEDDA